jgi:hypothetical protein
VSRLSQVVYRRPKVDVKRLPVAHESRCGFYPGGFGLGESSLFFAQMNDLDVVLARVYGHGDALFRAYAYGTSCVIENCFTHFFKPPA